ncbi:MAG: hypothetical protein Q8O55_04745 [Dehalococcoidales bacterium]|nr:hypothetical protein [Dehalococcoidales bacterium]
MKLFPDGGKVFEVISRYDDLLALAEREGYEPGDTLALIVPFLVLHDVSEADIAELAARASLTGGAADLLYQLQVDGWRAFCISTSYQQYALLITQKLGIYSHNVACTSLPLSRFRRLLAKEEATLIEQAEKEFLALYPPTDDERIRQTLDAFYLEKLPGTEIGKAIKEVKPVGGRRKVTALNRFAEAHNQPIRQAQDKPLSQWVVVGDSITDSRMLQVVEEAGGLAIAFNANEYALPYATMGLASTSIADLKEILQTWQKSQRKGVEKLVKQKEKAGGKGDRGYFHWLSGRRDLDEIIAVHKRIRKLVREEAGNLG